MSASPSIAKNTMMTYLSLHLIAKCTRMHLFEIKKNKNKKFMGRGHSSSPVPSPSVEGDIPSSHRSPLGASILAPSTPYCFFDKSNTDYYTLTTVNKNPDVWHSHKKNISYQSVKLHSSSTATFKRCRILVTNAARKLT